MKIDTEVLRQRERAEKNHILPNHRNTQSQRLHSNNLRRKNKAARASKRRTELEQDAKLLEEIHATQTRMNELRAAQKQLKIPKGTKRKHRAGKAQKGKSIASDPAYEDFDVEFCSSGVESYSTDSDSNDVLPPGLDLDLVELPIPIFEDMDAESGLGECLQYVFVSHLKIYFMLVTINSRGSETAPEIDVMSAYPGFAHFEAKYGSFKEYMAATPEDRAILDHGR